MNKSTLSHLALAGIFAGGISLTACAGHDSMSKSSAPAGSEIASAKSMAAFNDACTKAGGMVSQHDCKGQNGCKGHAYQEGMGVSQHDCKGQSSCKGAACVEHG